MKKKQHEKRSIVTEWKMKKSNIEKVKHEISETWKECNTKKKLHVKSPAGKKYTMKTMQHERSVTW